MLALMAYNASIDGDHEVAPEKKRGVMLYDHARVSGAVLEVRGLQEGGPNVHAGLLGRQRVQCGVVPAGVVPCPAGDALERLLGGIARQSVRAGGGHPPASFP